MLAYQSAFDTVQGLAVWCFQGKVVSSDLWDQHIADMHRIARWTGAGMRPCVLLHLADDRFVPNASQRQQVGEASRNPNYRPDIALITGSAVIRGILKTFSWFQGPIPYRIQPYEGIIPAIRWLESQRGRPLPRLLDLVERVHVDMNISPLLVAMARKQLVPDEPRHSPARLR